MKSNFSNDTHQPPTKDDSKRVAELIKSGVPADKAIEQVTKESTKHWQKLGAKS